MTDSADRTLHFIAAALLQTGRSGSGGLLLGALVPTAVAMAAFALL